MRLIHTSDWHIGRTLYDKRRHEEHAAFLDWLHVTIGKQRIDTLLICGDIFDTIAPGNRSLELYYSFLRRVADSGCRHVVVTGGNHDSPSLLEAPRKVLSALGVHVIGGATKQIEDEVIVLKDAKGEPEAVVCAVPFLRDRDVREVVGQETMEDKTSRLLAGIRGHYQRVTDHAETLRSKLGSPIPLIVMGHLFASGGKVAQGDGVRDLYVGNIAHVDPSMFTSSADYVALGHLHVPQKVGSSEIVRYSGSPIAMGFGEAAQQKEVILVDFQSDYLLPLIQPIAVPSFQALQSISGSIEEIEEAVLELVEKGSSVWVEIEYQGTLSSTALRQQLGALVDKTPVEILRLRNTLLLDQVLQPTEGQQTLDDLDEKEVFQRCLEQAKVEDVERIQLNQLYEEVLFSLFEEAPQ